MNIPTLTARNIGALFIVSWDSESPSSEFLAFCREYQPGGIIVFEEHCRNTDRLTYSIAEISSQITAPLLVAIDQEGGRVCRLKSSPYEYSSASYYGAKAQRDLPLALSEYRRDLGVSVRGIKALGINYFLGPVCDIDFFAGETALRDRVFGRSAEIVSAFVVACVNVCAENGLITCAKHAPGLGRATGDPHMRLSVSCVTHDQWQKVDCAPFIAAVNAGAESVMTSHFVMKDFDSSPVTFSRECIRAFVRPLAPHQTLVTDDLTMGALREFGEPGEIVSRAVDAGHDILLYRDFRAAQKGIDTLVDSYQKSGHRDAQLRQSLARVNVLRQKISALTV